jgi:hypothetical protein
VAEFEIPIHLLSDSFELSGGLQPIHELSEIIEWHFSYPPLDSALFMDGWDFFSPILSTMGQTRRQNGVAT